MKRYQIEQIGVVPETSALLLQATTGLPTEITETRIVSFNNGRTTTELRVTRLEDEPASGAPA